MLDACQSVSTFFGKLKLWKWWVEKVVAPFYTLDHILDENDEDGELRGFIKGETGEHMDSLREQLERFFPILETGAIQWLLNPFSAPDDDFPGKEQWIALRENEAWKLEFLNVSLSSFFYIARLADTQTLTRCTSACILLHELPL